MAEPDDNPFAALARLRASLPPGEPEAAPAAPAAPKAPRPPARAVLRLARKGYGGKTVTLVEHLGLAPEALDALLGELKRALGCGGRRDGDALVLQGDRRDRLATLLTERGVRRITKSG